MTTQTHSIVISQQATAPLSLTLSMYRTLARQLGDSTGQDVSLYVSVNVEGNNVVITLNYNPVRGFTKEELTVNK